jgi:hypothetical protein
MEVLEYVKLFLPMIGVVIGVAVSAFFESRRERRRNAREDQQELSRREYARAQDADRRTHEMAQEEIRRATENRVRFHAERLQAYVAFKAVCSDLLAGAQVWAQGGGESGTLTQAISIPLSTFSAKFQMASVLASEPARIALYNVHSLAVQLVDDGVAPRDVLAILEGQAAAMSTFETAVRTELGTG